MEPAIPDGAKIRIVQEPDGGFQVGMVVACLSAGNTLFAHRIVRCGEWRGTRYVLTLGDGWLLCDPPTAHQNIVGVVSAYYYQGSWQAPAPCARSGRWSSLPSRVIVPIVQLALAIHPEVARRVAGTCLIVGSWLKTLQSRLGRQ